MAFGAGRLAVSLTVLDRADQPLSGVRVCAWRALDANAQARAPREPDRSTVTDIAGRATLTLFDGDYDLFFDKPGYGQERLDITSTADSSVVAEAHIVHLGPATSVSGQVRDIAGSPIRGAQVSFSGSHEIYPAVRTDDRGSFLEARLESGHYDVTASAPGYQQEVIELALEAHRSEEHVDFRLLRGAQVLVRTRCAGLPCTNTKIVVYPEGPRAFERGGAADRKGELRIAQLPPGAVRIVAERYRRPLMREDLQFGDAGAYSERYLRRAKADAHFHKPVRVAVASAILRQDEEAKVTLDLVPISVPGPRSPRLEGLVVHEDGEIATGFSTSIRCGKRMDFVTPDAQGRFAIAKMPAGSCEILGNTVQFPGTAKVVIPSRNTILLQAGAEIQDADKMRVWLESGSDDWKGLPRLLEVPSGRACVVAWSEAAIGAGSIEVPVGGGHHLKLTPRFVPTLKVHGRVVDEESGRPIPLVDVLAPKAGPHMMNDYAPNTRSDQSGRFTLTGIAADGLRNWERACRRREASELQAGGAIVVSFHAYKYAVHHLRVDLTQDVDLGDVKLSRAREVQRPSIDYGLETFAWAFERPKAMSVIARSPAERTGVREGDIILSIGGMPTAGMGYGQLTLLLAGPLGSPIELELERNNAIRTVELERTE